MGARSKPQIRWTEEKKALVRQLHSEGRTSYEMMERLDVTRGAIMGLLSRLGLKQISKTRTRASYAGQTRSIKSKHFMYGKGFVPSQSDKPVPGLRDTLVLADDPRPEEQVTLLQLQHHHCRFPFGSGLDATYCGRNKLSGYSYCQQHRERTFTKTRCPVR